MGRRKLLVSCLLVIITLSEAILGSGRLSKIHLGYFYISVSSASGGNAICLQIRLTRPRTLFYVRVGVWAYDLRLN